MTAYVAFLRGINVGGNKTVGMAKLKTVLEGLGFKGVRTHLNSGNAVFAAKEKSAAKLAKAIEGEIERELGFRPTVIIRSASELHRIVDKNPFPAMAKSDPSHLLVMTLARKPTAAAKTKLAEAHAGPEEIRIVGEDVYLTYPNGIGRSKLTNASRKAPWRRRHRAQLEHGDEAARNRSGRRVNLLLQGEGGCGAAG